MIKAASWSRSDSNLPGFEHRFETVNGLRLHYVVGGKADGEMLILLAGFPESWFAWRKVMALLGEAYRIIALDLPGQGDSDRPIDGYDTQALAETVHNLLQQVGVYQYYMAGHDVGAWVAYAYAAIFGIELKRVVLLDAGIPGITLPDALPTAQDRSWRTWHFAFHAIPDLPEALIAGRERTYLNWFLRRKAANPETFSDADLDEYFRVFIKDGGLRAGLAYYRAVALSAQQHRALSAKGKLKMPVLALSGDQGWSTDMGSPLKAFAEDVRSSIVAHCGHFIPEEQPQAVADALIAFFSEAKESSRTLF